MPEAHIWQARVSLRSHPAISLSLIDLRVSAFMQYVGCSAVPVMGARAPQIATYWTLTAMDE